MRLHIYLGQLFEDYYVKGFYETIGFFFCCIDDCTADLAEFHMFDTVEDEYELFYDTEDEEEDTNWESHYFFLDEEDKDDLPFLRNSGPADAYEDWGTEDSIQAIESSEDYDLYVTTHPYRLVQRG